uniref:Uncharacterized protein n=1 Tax=Tanacetum cinerariifolium TaxID=118510 RepID=A0A699IUS2_TANCI|nr:hypothetical protein [Tanacetum cinerariifolium]
MQYSRRATRIAESKALSPAVDEPASLLRDDSQGEAFLTVSGLDAGHDRENIIKTYALPYESTPRVTSLDADEGESMEIGEEVGVERSTKLGSNDTKKIVKVLSSMEAVNILTSGVAAVSVPPIAGVLTVGVPTVSGLFPTVSAIFTTASVVTPYSRRLRGISAKDKVKEKVVESKEPKKKKLQEQIDAQVAKEIEEEITREDQRMNEQLARDAEIARIHAEEELKMLIDGLDRSNEITMLRYSNIKLSKVSHSLRRNKGNSICQSSEAMMDGKTKHFREAERVKRKGIKLDQGSAKRMKTSEDVSKEDLKGMMQLVPVEEALRDKENELSVELKRLFEPDFKDQMWTHNQNLMHDPLDWKLYDTCGVHHVFTKDQEIFMLVERDYPLRRGLAIVMICNKLQVENYSQMANDLILKIHNIANSPR